ncbi:MAG: class I SAM-dependent methyltransferase, partial [Candidatus Eremiobacteraeota bacterium]|nr:class I SAM-dependent methyltransferase [Candidatus Eremiobacteraeota bacterium]
MAKWMVKAAIQKTLSLLPDGHKLNYLFQKHVTKMHLGDAAMDQALVHCADHVRHMRSYGSGLSNCTTLELGTGWFAVVPIGLFLCGAERVMTIDVTPLLRTENLVIAIRRFIDYDDRGRLSEFLPDVDARRISAL